QGRGRLHALEQQQHRQVGGDDDQQTPNECARDEFARVFHRSGSVATPRARYFGVIFVILLPCMPRPAISPFWPKTKAKMSSFSVVVVVVLAIPPAPRTTLGPTPT